MVETCIAGATSVVLLTASSACTARVAGEYTGCFGAAGMVGVSSLLWPFIVVDVASCVSQWEE